MNYSIQRTSPTHPGAVNVLEQSHALMNSLYPAGACHYLKIDELDHVDVHFFAAQSDTGEVVGTGALCIKTNWPEVKSMFTLEKARGHGVAAALLNALIEKAKELGLGHLYLETGTGLDAAHRLYERFGFAYCGPFGSYKAHPHSIFMSKLLSI